MWYNNPEMLRRKHNHLFVLILAVVVAMATGGFHCACTAVGQSACACCAEPPGDAPRASCCESAPPDAGTLSQSSACHCFLSADDEDTHPRRAATAPSPVLPPSIQTAAEPVSIAVSLPKRAPREHSRFERGPPSLRAPPSAI